MLKKIKRLMEDEPLPERSAAEIDAIKTALEDALKVAESDAAETNRRISRQPFTGADLPELMSEKRADDARVEALRSQIAEARWELRAARARESLAEFNPLRVNLRDKWLSFREDMLRASAKLAEILSDEERLKLLGERLRNNGLRAECNVMGPRSQIRRQLDTRASLIEFDFDARWASSIDAAILAQMQDLHFEPLTHDDMQSPPRPAAPSLSEGVIRDNLLVRGQQQRHLKKDR